MKNRNAISAKVKKHKQAQKDLEATYLNQQQKYIQSQTDRIENPSENIRLHSQRRWKHSF